MPNSPTTKFVTKFVTNEILLEKINKLEETNILLVQRLEEIQKTTHRMEEHINFIEGTYNRVKTPFHYLMDKINLLTFTSFKMPTETNVTKEITN